MLRGGLVDEPVVVDVMLDGPLQEDALLSAVRLQGDRDAIPFGEGFRHFLHAIRHESIATPVPIPEGFAWGDPVDSTTFPMSVEVPADEPGAGPVAYLYRVCINMGPSQEGCREADGYFHVMMWAPPPVPRRGSSRPRGSGGEPHAFRPGSAGGRARKGRR